jgi:hypothetical protein
MGALLSSVGVIATGLWLWMGWANKGGRSWARIMATVFFVVLTAVEPTLLIALHMGVLLYLSLILFFVVYWLAGLSAVVLLWRRSSTDYYTAVGNWSKAAPTGLAVASGIGSADGDTTARSE